MKKTFKSFADFVLTLRVGLFLAIRQIKRSSKWTTLLIVFVMTLTFLNLVVVSGILVGLIEGSVSTIKDRYIGDVIVTTFKEDDYIEYSPQILRTARELPWTEAVTARYLESGTIEANYKERIRQDEKGDVVGTIIAGIDPLDEEAVTGLSQLIVEGEYLEPDDYDQVIVGGLLLKRYLDFESPGFPTLENVGVGDKVRVKVGDVTREVFVKGVTKSKADEIDRRVFFVDSQLRGLIGRSDYNVDEISIKIQDDVRPEVVRDALKANGFDEYATIQTFEEGLPKFLQDIKDTFALLGNVISSIGVVVASITIFIVIFINAITRRKYIGILKGIGVDSTAIEFAYILQSLFYAIFGTILGMILVFFVLKPYFAAYPINFPFSDGILVATIPGVLIRAAVLFIATLIAGYIPARIVVKQNTLDAILNR